MGHWHSAPRLSCGYTEKIVTAAPAAPLSRGLAHGVMVFAYPEIFETKSIKQHIITMAKTPRRSLRSARGRHATAKLRRQHIPPSVSVNCNALNNNNLSKIIGLLIGLWLLTACKNANDRNKVHSIESIQTTQSIQKDSTIHLDYFENLPKEFGLAGEDGG
jgi:hypothetical protein